MPVTLKDVAAAAQVSPSTVSQVLRNAENTWVSQATRERVIQVAQDLGYRPNPAARLLASRKGHYFAIVIRRINSMILQTPVRVVSNRAIAAGYTPFVVETAQLPWSHYDNIESLADAVVFIGTGDKEFHKRINQFQAGVATVVATKPVQSQFPEFIWDEAQGFNCIIDHLITLGHKHIALLGGDRADGNPERCLHFQTTCQNRGIVPLIIHSIGPEKGVKTGREMANILFKEYPHITAAIGRNIEFTLGALSECQHRGLRIPNDLSLVSFTDSDFADGLWPRLAALRTPIVEAAEKAADTALSLLSGQTAPASPQCLPIEFITGETIGAPRQAPLKM